MAPKRRKVATGARADVEVFEMMIGGEQFVVMSAPSAGEATRIAALSPAEAEVARDAAAGLTNAEIARRRGRSLRTVANQLATAYRKLGVASRAELTRLMLQRK